MDTEALRGAGRGFQRQNATFLERIAMHTRESRIDLSNIMVSCRATKSFTLNGKQIQAGQVFNIRQGDLQLVSKISERVFSR